MVVWRSPDPRHRRRPAVHGCEVDAEDDGAGRRGLDLDLGKEDAGFGGTGRSLRAGCGEVVHDILAARADMDGWRTGHTEADGEECGRDKPARHMGLVDGVDYVVDCSEEEETGQWERSRRFESEEGLEQVVGDLGHGRWHKVGLHLEFSNQLCHRGA